MIRHFCDKCDQQLIEPDEKIDFVTGRPTEADLCWQCRLQEIVELYNAKTAGLKDRPTVILHWDPPPGVTIKNAVEWSMTNPPDTITPAVYDASS